MAGWKCPTDSITIIQFANGVIICVYIYIHTQYIYMINILTICRNDDKHHTSIFNHHDNGDNIHIRI